jgi:hypothetical protein
MAFQHPDKPLTDSSGGSKYTYMNHAVIILEQDGILAFV